MTGPSRVRAFYSLINLRLLMHNLEYLPHVLRVLSSLSFQFFPKPVINLADTRYCYW